MNHKNYFTYILECSDKSYYVGVTSNLEKRIHEHNFKKYSGYTAIRLPVKLIWSQQFSDIKEAIKLEKQLKKWSRAKKEALIKGDFELLKELSKSTRNRRQPSTGSG
ncbi:MAG: GIY-YIG nuclease family protein [Bacteroidetes bacterium]|nr:GIY-YIG nuclease family protein [Bacteroidota bacterium]MBU2584414.1 GIY-YIG nuclease family protein [Bacteroidota bacterium]